MGLGPLEKRTRHKIRQHFRDDRFGERLLILLVMLLFLTIFFHFREVRVDLLPVNSTAKEYVVAQVDFQFPDREATLVVRREAVRDIGAIYEFSRTMVHERRIDFEDYLINHRDWRSRLYNITFEEVYNAADLIAKWVRKARLTDARTYEKIRQGDGDLTHYYVLEDLTTEHPIYISDDFWEELAAQITRKFGFKRKAVDYVVNYFSEVKWSLGDDVETQKLFRQAVEASIPDRYSEVKSGTTLVHQGQQVTPQQAAMLAAMKKQIAESRNLWDFEGVVGSLFFALIVGIIGACYLYLNHREVALSVQKLCLYVAICIITLIFAKLVEYTLVHSDAYYLKMIHYPLLVPFAALLICVLLNKNIALFTTFILTVIMGVSLSVDHSRFLFVNLVAGMATILFAKSMRKRKEVFTVCGVGWLSTIPVVLAFHLAENAFWTSTLLIDLSSTFLSMLLIAVFVIGVLPILESIFHIMTDITLMEYMDPNNDLLRRLSIEAPGTYQHSLVVGSLSEAAARAIGANGLFCRVSTLYHDIGKLFNPHYFTENQMGGFDIHQLLTPLESTQVIIAHVAEGEALARKYGLPRQFIDIIRQHHGTTVVYFFYAKQVEQMGGDVDAVKMEQFRYPGPKPRSKESAIIMIADTVEAASRAMDEPSEEALTELVNRLVSEKAEENQFDECQLTFEELGIVKRAIVKTLAVTRHLRIKYPERK